MLYQKAQYPISKIICLKDKPNMLSKDISFENILWGKTMLIEIVLPSIN